MRVILPAAGVEYDDAEAVVEVVKGFVELTVGDATTERLYTLNLSKSQAMTLAAAIEGTASKIEEV